MRERDCEHGAALVPLVIRVDRGEPDRETHEPDEPERGGESAAGVAIGSPVAAVDLRCERRGGGDRPFRQPGRLRWWSVT